MKAKLLVLLTLFSIFNISAEGFQIPSSKKKIHTLLITGNYVQTRLLAELVQHDNKQPIVLVPSQRSYSDLFVMLPKSAIKVKTSKFTDFVNFTGPKQVVFIGDDSKTDYSLINKLPVDKVKIYKLNDKDLMNTAWQLEELLDVDDLAEEYLERINLLKASGVIKRNTTKTAPPAEEPTVILPE